MSSHCSKKIQFVTNTILLRTRKEGLPDRLKMFKSKSPTKAAYTWQLGKQAGCFTGLGHHDQTWHTHNNTKRAGGPFPELPTPHEPQASFDSQAQAQTVACATDSMLHSGKFWQTSSRPPNPSPSNVTQCNHNGRPHAHRLCSFALLCTITQHICNESMHTASMVHSARAAPHTLRMYAQVSKSQCRGSDPQVQHIASRH